MPCIQSPDVLDVLSTNRQQSPPLWPVFWNEATACFKMQDPSFPPAHSTQCTQSTSTISTTDRLQAASTAEHTKVAKRRSKSQTSSEPLHTEAQAVADSHQDQSSHRSHGINGAEVTMTRVVVVGVDPDSHGAVAVASWHTTDVNATIDVQDVQVSFDVHDI